MKARSSINERGREKKPGMLRRMGDTGAAWVQGYVLVTWAWAWQSK